MAAASVLPKLVGQRVKRREDPRLIQGRSTYVDGVKIAGMQHLAFKRSRHRARPDPVHRYQRRRGAGRGGGGLHRRAHRQVLGPVPIGTPFPSPEHRAVAVDTVRFVGDPVAVVVARDRYVARDAVDPLSSSTTIRCRWRSIRRRR